MYAVYVKIDESLPWIELKGSFQTRKDARKAAERLRDRIQTKIATIPN